MIDLSIPDVSIKMLYHVPIANYTLQPTQTPRVNHPELVCYVCQQEFERALLFSKCGPSGCLWHFVGLDVQF
jgi:hypothetical protein